MNEPRWVLLHYVEAIHDEQLRLHGGASGLRDLGMLESALARPKNKWMYEGSGIPDLAASYAFGLARNHPFIDGNKRTAFLAAYVFLGMNGFDFDAPDAEIVVMTFNLAGGELDEDGYAAWLGDRVRRTES